MESMSRFLSAELSPIELDLAKSYVSIATLKSVSGCTPSDEELMAAKALWEYFRHQALISRVKDETESIEALPSSQKALAYSLREISRSASGSNPEITSLMEETARLLEVLLNGNLEADQSRKLINNLNSFNEKAANGNAEHENSLIDLLQR